MKLASLPESFQHRIQNGDQQSFSTTSKYNFFPREGQKSCQDPRQSPTYFKALLALRERDHIIDRAVLASELQMRRRYLSALSSSATAKLPTNSGRLIAGSILSTPPGLDRGLGGGSLNGNFTSSSFLPETLLTASSAMTGTTRNHHHRLFNGGRTIGEPVVNFPLLRRPESLSTPTSISMFHGVTDRL